MGEVYWGAFCLEGATVRPKGEECLVRPGQVPVPAGSGWRGAGSGFAVYGATLQETVGCNTRRHPAGTQPYRHRRRAAGRGVLPTWRGP